MHWPDLDNCKILTKVIFTRRPRGDRGRRRHQKRRHAEVFGMSVRAWKKRRHNSGKIFHSRIESLLFNWNNRRNHFTSYEQIYMFLKVSLAEWPMVVWLFGLTVCVWKLPKASLIIVRHTGLCTHCTLIVHSLSGSACFSTLLSFLHKHCFLREKTRRLKGRPEIQTRQFSPRKVGNEFKAFIGISLFLYEKYELLWKQNNETVFFCDISS